MDTSAVGVLGRRCRHCVLVVGAVSGPFGTCKTPVGRAVDNQRVLLGVWSADSILLLFSRGKSSVFLAIDGLVSESRSASFAVDESKCVLIGHLALVRMAGPGAWFDLRSLGNARELEMDPCISRCGYFSCIGRVCADAKPGC